MKWSHDTTIVMFQDWYDASDPVTVDSLLAKFPYYLRVEHIYKRINAALVRLDGNQNALHYFIDECKRHDEIVYCEYDYFVEPISYQDVIHASYQDDRSQNEFAHNAQRISNAPYAGLHAKIAMIDSGISPHPYLPSTSFAETYYRKDLWWNECLYPREVEALVFGLTGLEDTPHSPISKNATARDQQLYLVRCRNQLKDFEDDLWRQWGVDADEWFLRKAPMPSIPVYRSLLGTLRRISYESYNFIDDNLNVYDNHGHGTEMAGILASQPPISSPLSSSKRYRRAVAVERARIQNHEVAVAGIAPIAELMILKCYDDQKKDRNLISRVIRAMDYACDRMADVLYVGLAIPSANFPSNQVLPLAYQISQLKRENVLVVCPTGNSGSDELDWPAAAPDSVSVSAVTRNRIGSHGGQWAYSSFSSWADPVKKLGQQVQFCAFGGEVVTDYYRTTTKDLGFANVKGTSVAAAVACGIIARYISRWYLREAQRKYALELEFCAKNSVAPSMQVPLELFDGKLGIADLIKKLKSEADSSVAMATGGVPHPRFGWGVIRDEV